MVLTLNSLFTVLISSILKLCFLSSGYYLFSEASWPRKKGDKARLASGFISGTQGRNDCKLRFYYHMFGSDIGSLNVYTRPCNGCAETLVYSRSGDVGNFWDRAEVTLRSAVPFQVFKGRRDGPVVRALASYHLGLTLNLAQYYKWVVFVVGSHLALRVFLGVLWFSSL